MARAKRSHSRFMNAVSVSNGHGLTRTLDGNTVARVLIQSQGRRAKDTIATRFQ